MKTKFLQLTIGIGILCIYIVGCSVLSPAPTTTPTPTLSKPSLSDVFKGQLTRFLEVGTELNAMTEQGVNYLNYRDQLASVKGAYDLANATWPSDFNPEGRDSIEKALEGWDLALFLWELKIEDKDNPLEPNINGYQRFTNYAGDKLVIDVHPSNYIVVDYRGKDFLPFDENIGVLLALASDYFGSGRAGILSALP